MPTPIPPVIMPVIRAETMFGEPATMQRPRDRNPLPGDTDHLRRRATHLLGCLMTLAVICNGLYFWLQKSQLVPSPTYIEYRQKVEEWYNQQSRGIAAEQPKLILDGFHAVPGPWFLTKLAKDFFCLASLLAALLLWWQSTDRARLPPPSAGTVLLALFALCVAAAAVQSFWRFGPGIAVMGLRPFAYPLAGLLLVWTAGRIGTRLLTRYLVAILAIQFVLTLYEYRYGLPLMSTARLANRVNGTLSYPSSLGIFAVCVLAVAYPGNPARRVLLVALAAVTVYLTGSATALVLLAAWFGYRVMMAVPRAWRPAIRIGSLLVVAAMLVAMPRVSARWDVLDSMWGRIEVLEDYLRHLPGPSEVAFGKGLGIGSNVVTSMLKQSDAVAEPEGIDLFHARADSMPMALINQVGFVGALLFYLLLGVAAWRDRPALPAYLVLLLASLTINLLELFPVNFLLGLLLARSLLSDSTGSAHANGGDDGRTHLMQP